MNLSTIKFLNESAGGIALLTRVNADSESPAHHWESGRCSTHADSAVFMVKSLANKSPCALEVSLDAAVDAALQIRASTRTGLSFGSAMMQAGENVFRIESWLEKLFESGVQALDVEINWEFKKEGSDWSRLARTEHRIYLGLDLPGAPWKQEEGAYLPWTDALDVACNWAKGAEDAQTAASLITHSLYNSGRFSYDTSNGASNYTSLLNRFEITEFLERANGEESNGKLLNCTDCATIVSTLANLLGANLKQGKMKQYFHVRNILAIGQNEWAPPFDGSFSYHEVAWEDNVSCEGYIYDACLMLEEESEEGAAASEGLLPTRLKMGTREHAHLYVRRLTPDTEEGAGACFADHESERNRTLDT